MTAPAVEPNAPPSTPEAAVEPITAPPRPTSSHLTADAVWKEIERASFAVISWVTPRGEPRSSGIVYGLAGHKLYIAVAPDGWKARQLVTGQRVSVTVPVRRGGILSLLMPIPPATISFRTKVRLHPSGTLDLEALSPDLKRLLPADRKAAACILELAAEGSFLTYGVGVSLSDMRNPELSVARVPVA